MNKREALELALDFTKIAVKPNIEKTHEDCILGTIDGESFTLADNPEYFLFFYQKGLLCLKIDKTTKEVSKFKLLVH